MNSHASKAPAMNDMSLKQLLILLSNLRLSAVLTLIGIAMGAAAALIRVGEEMQRDTTAISLDRPFGLVISDASTTAKYPFPTLILGQGFTVDDANGKPTVYMTLRRKRDDGTYEPVGEISAQRPAAKSLAGALGLGEFGWPSAFAQAPDGFWSGYANNNSFRENFIPPDTVRRLYDNGAILEYKVDAMRRPIGSSLRWIKKV